MDIEFTTFVGKAPTIEAIEVTLENLDDLAAWMGADGYTVEKFLKGGERKVVFQGLEARPEGKRPLSRVIIRVSVGQWLAKYPPHVDEFGTDNRDPRLFAFEKADIDRFVKQSIEGRGVDIFEPAAPYDN